MHISLTSAFSPSPRSSEVSSESRDFSRICSWTSKTFMAFVTDSGRDPWSWSLLMLWLICDSKLKCLERGYSDPASSNLTRSSKFLMYDRISSIKQKQMLSGFHNKRIHNLLPFNPILLPLRYNFSLACTALSSSTRFEADISDSSLFVDELDPSPSSLTACSGGWAGGGGMGPPHSVHTVHPALSSSRYRHNS